MTIDGIATGELVSQEEPSSGRNDGWPVAERLLSATPNAAVAAIGSHGLSVPMPTEVPLYGQPVLDGVTSALDLVEAPDIPRVLDAWKRALQTGRGEVTVTPVDGPAGAMTLHLLDVRGRFQVVLAIAVRDDGQPVAKLNVTESLLRPRFCSVRKNELAEFTEVEESLTQLLGWPRQELIGRRNLELVHPDDHAVALANWIDLLGAPGRSRRVRLRQQHRDGRWIWFEITNHNRLNDPLEHAVVAEMIDISDEMAAQDSLAERERLLDRLTESLPVGVLQIRADGAVIHHNARVVEVLDPRGLDTAEAVFAGAIAIERPRLTAAIQAALNDGGDDEVEIALRRGDGAMIRCRITVRALADDGGALICIDDVTESARLREQLHRQATLDALTGCHNRASILAVVGQALAEAGRHGSGVAVAFIDLDGFKQINDQHGHAAGDQHLVRVARRLQGALRHQDAVGRIGGDEFLIVGRDVPGPAEALELGHRLAAALGTPKQPEATAVASIGVAWWSGAGGLTGANSDGPPPADQLVALADAAMYESKAGGRGRPAVRVLG